MCPVIVWTEVTSSVLLLTIASVVTGLDLNIEHTLVNYTAVEGGTAILPCTVRNLGKHKVVWTDLLNTVLTLMDRRITSDDRISISKPQDDDWNLKIEQVTSGDQGLYKCQVSTHPVLFQTVMLSVVGVDTLKPKIESTAVVNYTTVEGRTAILPCKVSNLGDHKVVWTDFLNTVLTLMDRRITSDDRISILRLQDDDWNLKIEQITSGDQGLYKCQVSTHPVLYQTVMLSVVGVDTLKPKIESTAVVNYKIVEGRTAILPCKVSNLGDHTVAWTDQWDTLLTNEGLRIIDDDRISVSRPQDDEWNFKIEQVTSGDQGLYKCQVNTTPVLYQTVMLSVVGVDTLKPKIESTTEVDYTTVEGRTAILPCKVSNLGNRKVAWTDQWNTILTLNEDRIIDDERISVSRPQDDVWNLKIEQVKYGDQGMYTCQINTTPTSYQTVMLWIVVACSNGTGECNNTAAEEHVPSTDKEENVQPSPVLKCELGADKCSNNTSKVAIPPVPSTDKEENAQPAPVLGCGHGAGDCNHNATAAAFPPFPNTTAAAFPPFLMTTEAEFPPFPSTTEAAFPNSDSPEEDTSLERMLDCDDELGGFGDCEKITTERDIPESDKTENAPVTPVASAARCEDGLYGDNCSIACPANCVTPKCDHVTGDCSSGCRIGYQGPRCAETCPTGYHGYECKSSCPTNCATIDCHHEHGYCLGGCKENYWGSDCSLLFKDNPEAEQDKFYQHLSAESKSVLLYVLMSKYEETLERAQMEVNRSLRLRSKLRAIMGA
ncbi:hypothetical protein BsWGS_09062 [Bradybaena similaris]